MTDPYLNLLTMDGEPFSVDPRDFTARPRIYVAGAYSAHPTHGTHLAIGYAVELLAQGWHPVVPHLSLLFDLVAPMPAEFWYAYDLGDLLTCRAVFVLPDLRTAESSGVANECDLATRWGIPIVHTLEDAERLLVDIGASYEYDTEYSEYDDYLDYQNDEYYRY